MDHTLEYYNKNAEKFVKETAEVSFSDVQERFLKAVVHKGHILDFGCGSGRDTKAFLKKGYTVTATDGSEELCRLASAYTKIPVKQMLFQELDDTGIYDGIWACSSILHLEKTELRAVIKKMSIALKTDGVIYTSFKYGTFEGERNGRYFTDFTEDTFEVFLRENSDLQIEDYWITGDVRPGRESEKWLNVLLRKNNRE